MRRRLLLARGLVHEPKLILLDEPTVGLDPQIRTELWTLIGELRSRGTTILMSTHYIEEAERLADEVAVMAKGRVISRGHPVEPDRRACGDRTPRRSTGRPNGWPRSRKTAEAHGPPSAPAGPRSRSSAPSTLHNGAIPDDAVVRAASLEDVFVLLTGEEAE